MIKNKGPYNESRGTPSLISNWQIAHYGKIFGICYEDMTLFTHKFE